MSAQAINGLSKWRRMNRVFTNAIGYLNRYGWQKGWGMPEGQTCVMGAIHLGSGASRPDESLYDSHFPDFEREVRGTLLEVINAHHSKRYTDPIAWNDTPGITMKSVLRRLEEAALLCEKREAEELAAQKIVVPRTKGREPARKPAPVTLTRKATPSAPARREKVLV